MFSTIGLYSRLESNCEINDIQLFTLVTIRVLIGLIITYVIRHFKNNEKR